MITIKLGRALINTLVIPPISEPKTRHKFCFWYFVYILYFTYYTFVNVLLHPSCPIHGALIIKLYCKYGDSDINCIFGSVTVES